MSFWRGFLVIIINDEDVMRWILNLIVLDMYGFGDNKMIVWGEYE